jgi:hypothetical protein
MRDTVKPFLPRRIPGERIAEPPQELSALRRLAFWRGRSFGIYFGHRTKNARDPVGRGRLSLRK